MNPREELANKIALHLKLDETPGYILSEADQKLIVEALRDRAQGAQCPQGDPYCAKFQQFCAALPPHDSGWLPIDDKAKDGRVVLLRRGFTDNGSIYAGYYGMHKKTFGAGADNRFPWVFLDPTNGVNQMRDGDTGFTHYRELASAHPQQAQPSEDELARLLWEAEFDADAYPWTEQSSSEQLTYRAQARRILVHYSLASRHSQEAKESK